MIQKRLLGLIRNDTENFWKNGVGAPQFKEIAAGKEIGHRIADYVDEKTTTMLSQKYQAFHELDVNGHPKPRSMGDVWIPSEGLYNPVNVKAGETGKNARPNLVSLNRLLAALFQRQIDSYYLLIVKMRIPQLPASAEFPVSEIRKKGIVPNVYLVDLLDYLMFVRFDAGPGQLMLDERTFYEFCDSGRTPETIPLKRKVEILVDMLEDGHGRLISNRKKKIEAVRHSYTIYSDESARPVDQRGLSFG